MTFGFKDNRVCDLVESAHRIDGRGDTKRQGDKIHFLDNTAPWS